MVRGRAIWGFAGYSLPVGAAFLHLGIAANITPRTDRPRVALVAQPGSSLALPEPGGAVPLWLHEVSVRLADAYDVTVHSTRADGQSERETHRGVTHVRHDSGADAFTNRIARGLDRIDLHREAAPWFSSPQWARRFSSSVAASVAHDRPEIVHVMNFGQLAIRARRAHPATRIVLHMHCEWLAELAPSRTARWVHAADALVGCSDYVSATTAQAWPNHRRATLFNGVAPVVADSRPPADPPTVVFIGRLSPEKGLHVLLEAWGAVHTAVPDARLVLIGAENTAAPDFLDPAAADPAVAALEPWYDGYEARLRSLARPFDDSVEFVGALPHDQAMLRLATAACCVNPSIRETFGMPVLEALAHGVPAIASDVGGLSELLQDRSAGTLVDRNDADALARAIIAELTAERSETDRAQRRASARAHAAPYGWDRIAHATHELYEDLLS